MQNTQFVEFYRQYADEDGEESREEVASDDTSRPDVLCVKFERADLVMDTFEEASTTVNELWFRSTLHSAENVIQPRFPTMKILTTRAIQPINLASLKPLKN